ncbi:MAG: hypothetical protein IEMM0008_0784 [bacterium]|nr:MAG: hypothetical protein IEMM0008_0784 [bacterium]
MSSKQDVSMKGLVSSKEAAAYLQDLITCFKAGTICVQQGDEFVTLKPEDMVLLEIEAEQKKDKEKFILEMTWRKGEKLNGDIDLKITSKEPEAVA